MCTRFVDMPVVNVGTVQNLFDALKESLSKKGLDFSNCLAFMFDTTNVMKGSQSGMQNECPHMLDVGCICHFADLALKAGMQTLPVDIDKLFVDVFYFFFHSSKRKQEFCDISFHRNPRQYLNTVLPDGLAFCIVSIAI